MSESISKQHGKGSYAPINGLNLYYEVHGSGEPLVLLHGGLGAIEMFGSILPQFARGREVIGVDLQAHGRTADIDRPLGFEPMADDIATLVEYLGHAQIDLLGYSLGGGVALQTAIRHPRVVRKLVLISAPFKRAGWYPEVLSGMAQVGPEAAEVMKLSPTYRLYASVAPRPEDWPRLLGQVGQLLGQEYDWSASAAGLKVPTLLLYGDADSIYPSHAVEFFELLGGGKADAGWDGSRMPASRLAILPGTTHYNILASPFLAGCITSFLHANT